MSTYYLAHPYSDDPDANLARAYRWLAWLLAMEPDHAIAAPWLALADYARLDGPAATIVPSDAYAARCLRDDLAVAAALGRIILCGGRVSPGMAAEIAAVTAAGGTVCDLIDLGDEPPLVWDHPIGPLAYGEQAARCA